MISIHFMATAVLFDIYAKSFDASSLDATLFEPLLTEDNPLQWLRETFSYDDVTDDPSVRDVMDKAFVDIIAALQQPPKMTPIKQVLQATQAKQVPASAPSKVGTDKLPQPASGKVSPSGGKGNANSYAAFLTGYLAVIKNPDLNLAISLDESHLMSNAKSKIILDSTVHSSEGKVTTVLEYLLSVDIDSLIFFDTVMKGVFVALGEPPSRMKYIGVLWNLIDNETRTAISSISCPTKK